MGRKNIEVTVVGGQTPIVPLTPKFEVPRIEPEAPEPVEDEAPREEPTNPSRRRK